MSEDGRHPVLIYDSVGDSIFLMAVEPPDTFRFVSVNATFLAVTGLRKEQVVGKRVQDVLPESSHALVLGNYKTAIRERKPAHWEEVADSPTGRKVGEVTVIPVFGAAGTCTHLVGAVHDVTEARQLQEAVRASEQTFRLLFANNPLPMWVYDLRTLQVLEVNEAAIAHYGYARDEFLQLRITDIAPPEDVPRLLEDVAKSRPALQSSGESRHHRKSGEVIDVQIASHRFTLNGREVVLVISHDVTDRKRAERALRGSEARKAAMLDTALDAIITIDHEGKITEFNTAAERIFGYARDYAMGRPMADLIIPSHLRDKHHKGLAHYLATREGPVLGKRIELTALRADGTEFPVELAINPIAVEGPPMFTAYVRDITDRRLAQEHLAKEHNLLRTMTDTLPDFISVKDMESRFVLVNQAYADFLGQPPTELIGKTAWDVFPREFATQYMADDQAVLRTGQALLNQESRTVDRFNNVRWHAVSKVPLRNSAGEPVGLASIARDITDRKQAEELHIYLASFPELNPSPIFETDGSGGITYMNPSAQTVFPALRPGNQLQSALSDIGPLVAQVRNGEQSSVATDVPVKDRTYQCVATRVPTADALRFYMLDITDRKRSERQIAQQLETLTALYAGAQKLSQSLDTDNLARDVVETSVKAFGARLAWVGRAEPDGTIHLLEYWPSEHAYPTTIARRWDESPSGQGPSGRAVRSRLPVVVQVVASEPGLEHPGALLELGITEVGAFPLISRDQAFGVLVLYSDRPDFFSATRLEFLRAFANQAAAALENARLFEETHGRIRQLQALRNIDMAITASLDLRVTLNVILDQTTTHLKVDAANVLIFDPHTQTLRHGTNRGFRTAALRGTNLRLGDGHAGRAALEQRMISVPNLAVEMAEFARSKHLPEEQFVAYMATPLLAKGQVKGVLEIFHRAPLNPTPDWLSFLEALAGEAAIAVDNSSLFDNLQRVNAELMLAYDTTLEGWSKALDLRDNETEGHTLRVTDLTLRLARAVGIADQDLTHIRRGALLHDIGKMGIPDSILLKPGPLTDEEWVVMKKHPVYAYELLAPISYLRLALDIPYCHHEKWDGTGYPRGLKQEEIPRAARIFAVIDVYDALSSDRPYRKAWAKDKVVAYIREQAGKHFDPAAAAQFLVMEMP